MSIWQTKGRIVITCAKGIPPFLMEELAPLGFPVLSHGLASVQTEGTMQDAMRLNLSLRTGHRVLFLLKEFTAGDPETLYKKVFEVDWEDLIPEREHLSVTSTVDHPTIRDSRFPNVKCKDAIVDRIKAKRGVRPDSGPERDGVVVHLYWKNEVCQLYLDTSGEPLSKRGYRKVSLQAPVRETLAAAIVLATGWRGDGNFLNPMCGSGTLAIEAALLALNRSPGVLRNNFGFMHLREYDESAWKALRRRIQAQEKGDFRGRIIATDISQVACEAAKKNAMTAGVDRRIEFGVCNFSDTPVPGGGGVVVLNPEYGERLGEIEKLKGTYKEIGDFFKKKCTGYMGYIFTGNPELAKRVGLKTKRRIPLFNGEIECRLLEYDLYEGSRKTRESES